MKEIAAFRKHQKLIEELPSPVLDDKLRSDLLIKHKNGRSYRL